MTVSFAGTAIACSTIRISRRLGMRVPSFAARWQVLWDTPRFTFQAAPSIRAPMAVDLLLRNARIAGHGEALDIGIAGGRIAALAPNLVGEALEQQLDGRLVLASFVETHIHLDKSCILDRCRSEQGTLKEAISEVAAAKRAFTFARPAPLLYPPT
jgi:hypothetical protein